MYAFINDSNIVRELIFDIPGVAMEERFPRYFLDYVRLVPVGIEVEEGFIFNPETSTYSKPPITPPEPATPDDEAPVVDNEPETYQEMVLRLNKENKDLRVQLENAIEANQMLEDCIIEMADIIYA